MEKNKKIILGIILVLVAIVGVVFLLSILTSGPSAEMSGKIYYEGDYISFTSFNGELELDTYVYSISEDAMYSKTKDGEYTVMWDLKKGSGTLVNYPDDYIYPY